jgi:hypothetical protein
MNALQLFKGWIGAITEVGLMLLALAIVASILVGPDNVWVFKGVVTNLVGLVNDLGASGLAGLIVLGIILWLFSKRAVSYRDRRVRSGPSPGIARPA